MCETVMAVSHQLDIEPHPPENGFVTPDTSIAPGLLTHIDARVLPSVGGFGKYQKQLIVLTWIPALFIGFSQFSDNFLLAQPQSRANTSCESLSNHNHALTTAAPREMLTGVGNDSTEPPCECAQSGKDLENGLERNVVTKVRVRARVCVCVCVKQRYSCK